jgi:membrane protein
MKKLKNFGKQAFELLKMTFAGFSEHRVTKLSGALAYYMVFSMGPMIIVIISLCGIFLGAEASQGRVYGVLRDFVGSDTAESLQEMIANASLSGGSFFAVIIGSVVLLIGATTVFAEIQDSINLIWGIKPKPKRGWLKYLKNRFLSFSVIVSLGFLLIVSLALTTLFEGLGSRLEANYPNITFGLIYVINLVIALGISTLVFGTIFKVLPDAKIRWRDVFAGAIATSILFMIGKFAISLYVTHTNVGSTFGSASSLVVLLVWVYYSAVILYIGAEFTKAYATKYGHHIHPKDYAVTIQEVVVEKGSKSVQQVEEHKQQQTEKQEQKEALEDKRYEEQKGAQDEQKDNDA